MRFEIEEIGPERAKELLDLNTGNFRAVSKHRVVDYARDMAAGNWEENGEPIKLNGARLLDGQHRLLAIVASKQTVKMVVVYDVPSEGLHIDSGKSRSISDWLRHKGYLNAVSLSAVARLVLAHRKGHWNWGNTYQYRPSREELLQLIQLDNEAMQNAIRSAGPVRDAPVDIARNTLAAVLFLGAEDFGKSGVSACHTAQWFAQRIADGSDLGEREPVHQLRERLVKSAISPTNRLHRDVKRALVVLAWNKTVLEEEVGRLSIAASGPRKRAIPEVLPALR